MPKSRGITARRAPTGAEGRAPPSTGGAGRGPRISGVTRSRLSGCGKIFRGHAGARCEEDQALRPRCRARVAHGRIIVALGPANQHALSSVLDETRAFNAPEAPASRSPDTTFPGVAVSEPIVPAHDRPCSISTTLPPPPAPQQVRGDGTRCQIAARLCPARDSSGLRDESVGGSRE